jgi:hypothetical protein
MSEINSPDRKILDELISEGKTKDRGSSSKRKQKKLGQSMSM